MTDPAGDQQNEELQRSDGCQGWPTIARPALERDVAPKLSQSRAIGFLEHYGVQASGWEIANLQTGVDVRVTPGFHLGPFVAITAAEYATRSTDTTSSDFQAPAPHGWLVLGVRGVLDVWRQPPAG